jgi:hypothetical protein
MHTRSRVGERGRIGSGFGVAVRRARERFNFSRMDCAPDQISRPGLLQRVVCSAGGEADADSVERSPLVARAGSFYERGR